jgi:hypothetical protein
MGRLGVESIEISALATVDSADHKNAFSFSPPTSGTVTPVNGNIRANGYVLADNGNPKVHSN